MMNRVPQLTLVWTKQTFKNTMSTLATHSPRGGPGLTLGSLDSRVVPEYFHTHSLRWTEAALSESRTKNKGILAHPLIFMVQPRLRSGLGMGCLSGARGAGVEPQGRPGLSQRCTVRTAGELKAKPYHAHPSGLLLSHCRVAGASHGRQSRTFLGHGSRACDRRPPALTCTAESLSRAHLDAGAPRHQKLNRTSSQTNVSLVRRMG